MPESTAADTPELPVVSRGEFLHTWSRIALLSFGGPSAQIAVMHRILVDEKRWIDESQFLRGLNFCMLLPGPEAQQLATWIGWMLRGFHGGLIAGLLFILPGLISILALSLLYVTWQNSTVIASVFFGLKCAVLAVIVEAVLRISRRVLKQRLLLLVSIAAFLIVSLRLLSFPAVIGLAALAGIVAQRLWPAAFASGVIDTDAKTGTATSGGRLALRSVMVSAICLGLWFSPILLASRFAGRDSVYVQSAAFFSKAAVVTFGGAYSVLSYVEQQAVDRYGWLHEGEMMDGLALAETTPGPLIMVVQFVGFLAAWRHGTGLPPLWAGTWNALLTTWVTFVPCFYWIFLFAPFIERLQQRAWLAAGLKLITAAVVGVIASLGVTFAVSTLFAVQSELLAGPARLAVPVWTSFRPAAGGLTLFACVLLLALHRGLGLTLAACAAAGCLLNLCLAW